jgi:hypothetical protein
MKSLPQQALFLLIASLPFSHPILPYSTTQALREPECSGDHKNMGGGAEAYLSKLKTTFLSSFAK